jgi:hypothetical protein
VNLATYEAAGELYLARGDDVNPNRPVFTGDVYHNVAIPGVQDKGMGLVVAHPCSFRIGDGQLAERVLTASVESVAKQGPRAWTKMFSDRMPLTDLEGEHSYWAGHLDKIGRALASDLLATERLACLSAFGVNMLQQRLTYYLTRAQIPTATFNEAFGHTFDEAELLEEWTDTLVDAGQTKEEAAMEFETFVREGNPSLQDKLRDPQHRSAVRRACRLKASELAKAAR